MAEPAARRNVASASATVTNTEPPNAYLLMEDICEKLKILNYESELLKRRTDLKPLSRVYFAIQTKPSEQFPYFSYLVQFLFRVIGIDVLEWNEYDDPNTISNNIIEQCRKLGFNIDFPASKLRHGSGDSVCMILDFLCDKALSATNFQVLGPVYTNTDTGANDNNITDDIAEEDDEKEEDLDAIHDEIDELADAADLDNAIQYNANNKTKGNNNNIDDTKHHIIESKVDPAEWKLELERVFPKLKINSSSVSAANNSREWRFHIDSAAKHNIQMNDTYPNTKSALEKISQNLKKQVDKIQNKEKQINREYEHLSAEFKGKQKLFNETQEMVNLLTNTVNELNNELTLKTDQVEQIKQQMTEKNNNMTDTQPLRKISTTLANMKKEVLDMELRIGVTAQTLLISKMKHHSQKLLQQQQALHVKQGNVKGKNNPTNNRGISLQA